MYSFNLIRIHIILKLRPLANCNKIIHPNGLVFHTNAEIEIYNRMISSLDMTMFLMFCPGKCWSEIQTQIFIERYSLHLISVLSITPLRKTTNLDFSKLRLICVDVHIVWMYILFVNIDLSCKTRAISEKVNPMRCLN